MRASIYLCLVAFVLLVPGLCFTAEEQPVAPWINQVIKPANGMQLPNPRPPVITEATPDEPELIPTCFRIVQLMHRSANEMVPLFAPKTNSDLRPFLPRGIFVSRAGDHTLLVTAGREEDLDGVERLVKLLDVPAPRALLEVMLVETTKFVPLPNASPDGTLNDARLKTTQMMGGLAPFLQQPDTIIYRTFLDIPNDQQGVLDLSAYPLPVKSLLFGRVHIHPDNTAELPVIPLYKEEQVGQKLVIGVHKDHGVLLLNTLLTALKPVEDPAGKAHYFYLLVGVNICRDGSVHLTDGMRPLRVFYDGRKKPLLIPLQQTNVEILLLHGAWLEDTVTPPGNWPQQAWPPFAASPGMNALLVTGDERQRAVLQQLIPSFDFPQPALQVEGQYYRIAEKDVRELGLRQSRNGDWPLPFTDAGLSRKMALSLVNNKAKLITMPRVVAPFGTGGVEEDGWGLQVDCAYTWRDGSIGLQVSPVIPHSVLPRAQDAKTVALVLRADRPAIAGVFPLNDGELLLFVVKAAPVNGDEPSGMQYLPPLF